MFTNITFMPSSLMNVVEKLSMFDTIGTDDL